MFGRLIIKTLVPFLMISCGRDSKWSPLKDQENEQKLYRSTRWLDGREKIIFDPANQPKGLSYEGLARAWLRQESKRFGISDRLLDLRLQQMRRSAYGIHYIFVTPRGRLAVQDSVLIVSLTDDGQRIYRVYNGLKNHDSLGDSTGKLISSQQATQSAWKHLKVEGALLAEPEAKLVIDNVQGKAQEWWIVQLETTKPAGSWKYWINPVTGQPAKVVDLRRYWRSLPEAMKELDSRKKSKEISGFAQSTLVSGAAKLFVVDPRTVLKSDTLRDDSPAKDFEPAYETRPLEEISHTDRGFELVGPRVTLDDWDSPFNPVSISPDGHWNEPRGHDSFDDAMTYWHLDQSMQYLEGLGFRDDSRIFTAALLTDANGNDGGDNSFFTPVINGLSFGHGCVDDNEDPDVILHEMGHAINAAINPYFEEGDTGAMGEGFGDYWAVSYGYSDQRNKDHDRFRVFNWDGSSNCWDGRRADRFHARFKKGKTYAAHANLPDGTVSDELWSTPLVGALDELTSMGVSKKEVDLIVLESQYGLAHGLTMTDWANAMVQTASMLYPEGPHKDVFARKFKHHLILSEPAPELVQSKVYFVDAGKNEVPDPGEMAHLKFEIFNIGDESARDVKITLKSKSDWAQVANSVEYLGEVPDLRKVANTIPFSIQINPKANCGSIAQMEAIVTSSNTKETVIPFEFTLGIPRAATDSFHAKLDQAIPDHNQNGAISTISVQDLSNRDVRDGFSVDVAITHPLVTDLKLILTSPDGHEVILKSFLSGNRWSEDVIGNYPKTLKPVEDLSILTGTPMNGKWTLQVVDGFKGGEGKFVSWAIHNPTDRALCEP